MAEEQSRTWTETIQLEGGQLLDKVREVIHQGNVRRMRKYRPRSGGPFRT